MSKLARAGRWLEANGPEVLLWIIWGCVIYNGFSAISEYTDAHGLFPEPWGGYAMAITVDGMLVFAFLTFRRAAWWMAMLLLVTAATTTYMLQRWHAEMIGASQEEGMHTLIVAGIVPGAMVLVTLAWHLIRLNRPVTERVHGLEVLPLPPEAIENMQGIQDRKERTPVLHLITEVDSLRADFDRKDRGLQDRSLASERPTEAAPVTARPPMPNGSGSPRQRALHVLREQPGLTIGQVAAAARVSERTVRNAKADLMGERGI